MRQRNAASARPRRRAAAPPGRARQGQSRAEQRRTRRAGGSRRFRSACRSRRRATVEVERAPEGGRACGRALKHEAERRGQRRRPTPAPSPSASARAAETKAFALPAFRRRLSARPHGRARTRARPPGARWRGSRARAPRRTRPPSPGLRSPASIRSATLDAGRCAAGPDREREAAAHRVRVRGDHAVGRGVDAVARDRRGVPPPPRRRGRRGGRSSRCPRGWPRRVVDAHRAERRPRPARRSAARHARARPPPGRRGSASDSSSTACALAAAARP